MDIADQASDREMADREFALAAQRAARSAGPSCSHCLDCGEPIPASRFAWNANPHKNIKGEPTHDRTN